MNAIAFDTASEFLDIALLVDDRITLQYKEIGLKHSEYLITSVIDLCSKAHTTLREIDLIICTRGPGSFTGLRIGMSAAKGLAYGLQIPIVSVPTLDVYADYIFNHQNKSGQSIISVPVIDAKKQRFYSAVYIDNSLISNYLDIAAEDLYDTYLQNYSEIHFSGPDVDKLLSILQTSRPAIGNKTTTVQPFRSIAEKLLTLGIEKFDANGTDPITQGPLYIRSSI